ncbi:MULTISPECIES: phenylalanine--tRNA ligase subunit beta [unclassified Oleiphilus]|jgi:phenylalanyl-tRNA synthetase beta chain|uniref:phenylalanine--tRNA ligase subunit beta n=11 Tax=Oleiphilus TaxID=141450 RepID=UPI0007C3F170|nr:MULTISPECIES: phenylalanine--tRNA ligase subunit beta [unclassified Oleiphilus]KZY40060.1 phenylalanine--tRNA ligase subunit beta [Oleiphilus sp. HI0050]KZY78092.1 phenylalanine--tRNA ligase subunit beta [Oleiphilus sp. HI0068]KZY86613.1 phenylalanine--tRNA ligase subunit beta [Oleiphilus sp. HI0069]KZY96529.1 phenylalanine--tRNA ligase subunit beta [Oleiphilus sp. HI0072]KZZ13876.1 phenylalanine--tRNA ligase subunit beta [Oleiphilus sp. HI0078]
MKFSEQWLREWVNPSIGTDDLLHQITMAGLEVDGMDPVAGEFTGVVVGEVLSKEQHPDADKLSVCQVSDGKETVQVVCGAANVREGLKVPFAKIGAVLPGNFKIKKAKLRGVESFGMLSAESELGLAESSDGLMELPVDAPVGACIREYLGLDDNCIDVDLTPNRSDCLSIAGLAREVGVLNKENVTKPQIESVVSESELTFKVNLQDTEGCPKYLGRVIEGVDLTKPSPLWLQEKLRRCGLRSIDPAVDVTNYILLELGQPMHAFDLDKLNGSINVRQAENAEKLTLLDGQEVELRDDTLVIADENTPLAIAGIMGGEASGVSATTQNIFLECAFFAPLAIAGKARSYGLHTDSSHRFERGVDYALQHEAMERATRLLIDIVGGKAGPIVEESDAETLPKSSTVTLRETKVESLLGLKVETAEIEEILTRLGLEVVDRAEGQWTFAVPSYRFDIAIEPDLIEEIGRVYGYNKLPKTTALGSMKLRAVDEDIFPQDYLADRLVSLGYQEAITYSFVDEETQKLVTPEEQGIALANPISADLAVMRTSLWPGLLKALSYNQKRQQPRVKFFETGLKFVQEGEEIVQTRMISGVVSGTVQNENWCNESRAIDFFDVKADLENLLFSIDPTVAFEKGEHAALHPGQTAQIVKNGKKIGYLGAIHPKLQKSLDLNGSVYLFELCLIETVQGQVPSFDGVSKYPEVRRDLAILIDHEIPFRDVEQIVRDNAGEDLVNLNVFDVYSGDNLAENGKSLGLGLVWQRSDRTLNDEEINESFERIVSALSAKFGAKLRS